MEVVSEKGFKIILDNNKDSNGKLIDEIRFIHIASGRIMRTLEFEAGTVRRISTRCKKFYVFKYSMWDNTPIVYNACYLNGSIALSPCEKNILDKK